MKINIVGQRNIRYVIVLGVGIFRSELKVRNVQLTKGRDISLYHCVQTRSEAFEHPNH
jgi:hypothetical protein